MSEIKDKVVLVTGSSRGIGRACALAMAHEGANVVVNYVKNEKKALDVVAEIEENGGCAISVKADISDHDQVESMKNSVKEQFGALGILVNNAGIHQHLKSWELSHEDWNRVIGVNLTGVFNCTRAFVPDMKSGDWGRIVNIASVIADIGTDHEVHYAASKGGVVSATKALALELAPFNITVNAVSPGYIETDMTKFSSDEEKRYCLNKIPLRRLGDPKEIADSVVFLCSTKASYITGQVLHVNGGLAFP